MKMLNFISMLGNAWDKALKNGDTTIPGYEWVVKLFDYLYPILYAIMAVVGAAGVIYSVYLGVQLAKAEDQPKRDEAKKRLITTVIAVAVTLVLIIFFNELLPLIIGAVVDKPDSFPGASGGLIHL